jgi:chemotaxis protein histidine kinase CheA
MSWLLQRWQSLVSLFQTPISVRVKDQPAQRSTMAVTSQERLRLLVHSLKQYEQRINRLGQGIAEYYNFSIIGQRKGYSGWLSEELHSGNYVSFHRLSQEIGQLVVQAREAMADREAHGEQADAISIQIRSLCISVTSGMERIRVLPVIEAIDTLPASLRKLAQNYNKVVDIALEGQQVLVPREMLGELSALIEHLMTFSLLSSIEPSSTRLKVGKPTRSRLMVRFSQTSSRLELEVIDDGAGLDEVRLRSQIFARELLTPIEFECLSREELMTMAVGWGGTFQYANLEKFRLRMKRLGATLNVSVTPGKGMHLRLHLPYNLVSSHLLLFAIPAQLIAIPRRTIQEVVSRELLPQRIENGMCYVQWRGRQIRYFELTDLLQLPAGEASGSAVILQEANRYVAVGVLRLEDARPVVREKLPVLPNALPATSGMVRLQSGQMVPLLQPEALFEQIGSRAAQAPVKQPKGTVLVIDDSHTARDMLSLVLLRGGYTVRQATDGLEALEMLKNGLECGLIFCDLNMPRMGGLEFLAAIANEEHLSRIPVTMLTARVDEEEIRDAYELGARAYFNKPFNDDEILAGAQRFFVQDVVAASRFALGTVISD